MTITLQKQITIEEVSDGKVYEIHTTGGKIGLAKAEVKEEWTEVHPRVVYFVPAIDSLDADNLRPGDGIAKIFDKGL